MEKDSALLVVDVQKDFCSGGALAVPGGDEVVPVLNRYIAIFTEAALPVFASRDWHPALSRHFRQYGGVWPVHCVQESRGAAFHERLMLPERTLVLSKGVQPEDEGFSCLESPTPEGSVFSEYLLRRSIRTLYIGGLATDFCVKATALAALERGFSVVLLEDAVRGVDLQPGDSARAIEEMISAGARLTDLRKITGSATHD
jgi:nicotinamidase/pyrazinamidase